MQLRAERDRFVVEHLGELAASREHDAHAARDAVVEALEAIDVTERAYAEIERFYTELLRPVLGVDGRDVPSLISLPSRARRSAPSTVASRHRCPGPSTAVRTLTRRLGRPHEALRNWDGATPGARSAQQDGVPRALQAGR